MSIEKEARESEEAQLAKKRIIKLLKVYYPVRGVETGENDPASYANFISVVLNKLLNSKQLNVWPKDDQESTWPIGESIRLAYFDSENKAHVSEEFLIIPERPESFLDALEAFSEGRSWEEVQALNAFDPQIGEKEIAKSVKAVIDNSRNLSEASSAIEYIIGANISTKKILTPLLIRLDARIEKIITQQAENCVSFSELSRIKSDARSFFTKYSQLLSSTSSYDALDARAAQLALELLRNVKTKKGFEATLNEVAQYTFSFEGYYKNIVSTRLEDVRAQVDFMLAIRKTQSITELNTLQNQIQEHECIDPNNNFPFQSELLEILMRKRETLIRKKQQIYP